MTPARCLLVRHGESSAWVGRIRRRAKRGLAVLVLTLSMAGLLRELPDALARGGRDFVDTPARAALYGWIRGHTPATALVLTPPSGIEDLPLHTGRAGYVQFKQVPTAAAAIRIWFTRLSALAGGRTQVWEGPGGWAARDRLVAAYTTLSPADLTTLAERSGAGLLITLGDQPGPEGRRPAHRNTEWTAWRSGDAKQTTLNQKPGGR